MIIFYFKCFARVLFVLKGDRATIEFVALFASLLSMLLPVFHLGITNRLPLRLSLFSTQSESSDCGSLFLFHLQITLESWMIISSSSFNVFDFFSLLRVCIFSGPMFFQRLQRAFSRVFRCLVCVPYC